jgi:hypothetical protein
LYYFALKIEAVFISETKQNSMKTYGGVELQFHAFLTSALDADEWLGSRPGCFTAEGKNPEANRTGDCVRLRVCLNAMDLPLSGIFYCLFNDAVSSDCGVE